jgi:hypothetical protein
VDRLQGMVRRVYEACMPALADVAHPVPGAQVRLALGRRA